MDSARLAKAMNSDFFTTSVAIASPWIVRYSGIANYSALKPSKKHVWPIGVFQVSIFTGFG
jgi:hypothetical protein